MNDTATQVIISDLIASGRLVVNGQLTLDGQLMAESIRPVTGQPDKYGWLPPETAEGGRQNVEVNKILDEWAKSDDADKRAVAKRAPRLFIVMTDNYAPEKGTKEWMRIWHNNNKQFFLSGANGRIKPFFDGAEKVEGHWFYCGQNYTWMETPGRGENFLAKIVDCLNFWLTDALAFERHGGLSGRN